MRLSFLPPIVVGLLIIFLIGLAAGGLFGVLGGHYLWPSPDAAVGESAESAYYRGLLASCVGIGMKQGIARDTVTLTCGRYMEAAFKADWFTELMPDTWIWPPPSPEKKRADP